MRTVFVGDVHGCLDELRELMAKLGLVRGDTLVFVGDLIDRGPDPVGVVRYVREMSALDFVTKVNKGNHEEKALRWLRHEDKVAAGKQTKNPMKPVPDVRMAEWRALNAEDRAFLQALPLVHEFDVGGQPWVSVHGGLLPGRPLADQVRKHPDELIRCRWVNEAGQHVGMLEGSREMPPGAAPWMERFDGQFNVVCGHAVHREAEIKAQVRAGAPSPGFPPRVDKTTAGFEVWSIDTGCFGGGRLTALVLDHDRPDAREVVQVQARAAYFDFKGDSEGGS